MKDLQFPTVTEKTIKGIRVAHIKTPHLFTYAAFTSIAGAYTETKQNAGVAHVLEHMLFKGTKKRNLFDISDDAALMGAIQNAYTSNFEVCYHLTAPYDFSEGTIELLCDMMFNSIFPENEWNKERTVIQEERKMYDNDHSQYFHTKIGENLFTEQPGRSVIGYEDTINGISRDDIVNFRKRFYGKDNTLFLVASPVDANNIFSYCEKYFDENELADKAETTDLTNTMLTDETGLSFVRPGIDQTWVNGIFNLPEITNDHIGNVEVNFVLHTLGGGMSSLLFKEIREKLGLCYSIHAGKYYSFGTLNTGSISTQLSPENLSKAKEKIYEVINDLAENGIDKKSFDSAKAAHLTSIYGALGSSQGIAKTLNKKILLGLDYSIENYMNAIKNVTLEGVNTKAKSLLTNLDIKWAEMSPEVKDN